MRLLQPILMALLAGALAAAATPDPDAERCAGSRAYLAAAAWKHLSALPHGERAPGTIEAGLLAERGALPRKPACGEAGAFAIAFTGRAVAVLCARHGATEVPRPAPGGDPLEPFRRGCAASQRTIEIALGFYSIERGVDEESAPELATLLARGYLAREPACPAGGRYRIANERGALHPDCSLHGPIVSWSDLPAAETRQATAPVRLVDSAEGRAKICAENRQSLVDAIERVGADIPFTEETEFRIDLLLETGYLKTRLSCPEAGDYAIRNVGREIRVECPRHGRHLIAY